MRCIAKDNLIILSERVDMGGLRKGSGGDANSVLGRLTLRERLGSNPGEGERGGGGFLAEVRV